MQKGLNGGQRGRRFTVHSLWGLGWVVGKSVWVEPSH